MSVTYLTTDQLASRIHYDSRTIRNSLKDAVLLEGIHYIRPSGGRKLLFLWEAIERDIGHHSTISRDDSGIAVAERNAEVGINVVAPPTPPRPGPPITGARDSSAIPMAAGGVCGV